jgi:hypothetical protein
MFFRISYLNYENFHYNPFRGRDVISGTVLTTSRLLQRGVRGEVHV